MGTLYPKKKVFKKFLKKMDIPFKKDILEGDHEKIADDIPQICKRSPPSSESNLQTIIKCLNTDSVLLEIEAQKNAQSHSEYIVKILAAFQVNKGIYYLELEYLIDGDMFNWIINCEPNVSDLAIAYYHIIKGLTTVHHLDWIHYDVKPDNVFIGRNLNGERIFKLGDFGLALQCPKYSKLIYARGSVEYASPEVKLCSITNSHSSDHRTDVWSLGILIFVSFVSYFPEVDHYIRSWFYTQVRKPNCIFNQLENKSGLTKHLQTALSGALEINDNDRLNSDQMFILLKKNYYHYFPSI